MTVLQQCHDKREREAMMLSHTPVPGLEESDTQSVISEESSFSSHARLAAAGSEGGQVSDRLKGKVTNVMESQMRNMEGG